jgi:kojibiose phosphorylase
MEEVLGVERIDETQVVKQPDVIMLLCLLRDQFDRATWRANWDYYNPRTDHTYGSSLGPAMQAWAACQIDRPDLAYEHFIRAARVDLDDIRGNADDGIHAASAGGLWQAVVFGFAGLIVRDGRPSIDPRLPAHWQGVSFKFQYRGETYRVDIKPGESSLTVI